MRSPTAAENRESPKDVPGDEIAFRQLQKARRPDHKEEWLDLFALWLDDYLAWKQAGLAY